MCPKLNPVNISVSTCLTSLFSGGGPSHKMAACASNSPFKGRRGEGEGGGGWREKKQMSCDANSKKSPICFTTLLQHILGRASLAACRQTLSHIRPTRCSSLSSSLTGCCCTFKPPPALSSVCL